MKAQVSVEFMMFLAFVLLMLCLASYASLTAGRDIGNDNEVTAARIITAAMAGEINIATEIGPGYSHRFVLPASLIGNNYTIDTNETGFVNVKWKDKFYSLPVLSDNITGSVRTGQNVIRNLNGVIVFE